MRRALALVLVLAGCGGEIGTDDAREAVEDAAGVELREVDPPAPEVQAAYTTSQGGHFIQLFVLKKAEDADTLRDAVPSTAQAGAVRTVVKDNVFVVYAASDGTASKGDAVVRAVEDLG